MSYELGAMRRSAVLNSYPYKKGCRLDSPCSIDPMFALALRTHLRASVGASHRKH